MKTRDDVDVVRMNGDDVRMLEQGESLRLARAMTRNLEGHRPIGEVVLVGEKDPRHAPAAQLLDQPKANDRLADPGKWIALLSGLVIPEKVSPRVDKLVDVD